MPFLPLGVVCVRGGHPKWPVAKEIQLLVSESAYKFGTRIILASWIIFFLGLARELLFQPIGQRYVRRQRPQMLRHLTSG